MTAEIRGLGHRPFTPLDQGGAASILTVLNELLSVAASGTQKAIWMTRDVAQSGAGVVTPIPSGARTGSLALASRDVRAWCYPAQYW
jgi:hypothetical protein